MSVTVCAVVTAETIAEKLALVAPAATVKDDGTVTAELLLARLTENPPIAAAVFSVIEQASDPAPVIDALVQETVLRTGTPVPARLIKEDAPADELLRMETVPLAAPALAGSN